MFGTRLKMPFVAAVLFSHPSMQFSFETADGAVISFSLTESNLFHRLYIFLVMLLLTV